MIVVDVGLAARPRILGPGASISETVDLSGGLGTDIINSSSLTDPISAVVLLGGDLTGGRIALSGSISLVIDPVATRKRLFIQAIPTNYPWYYDGYDENPWAWVFKPRDLMDSSNPEENPTYSLQLYATSTLSVTATVPMVIPAPPAPAPPVIPGPPSTTPVEPAANFPMPASGGIVVRALHGVVVDMDAPVVVDGIPT